MDKAEQRGKGIGAGLVHWDLIFIWRFSLLMHTKHEIQFVHLHIHVDALLYTQLKKTYATFQLANDSADELMYSDMPPLP